MRRIFDFAMHNARENTSLRRLREELLEGMLLISFLIGTALFVFALIPAIQKNLYFTISIYAILYIWIVLITFLRRVSYRIRSISWLIFFFVLGVINLFLSGFNVDAGLFLLALVAMASLMGGIWGGLIALGASSIAIAVLGFIIITGDARLSLGLPQTNPMLWIIGGTIFLLMGFLLATSLSVVIHGLGMNLTKANALTEELKRVNNALRQSEDRYRTLVETSPDLILLLDTSGEILVINKAGLSLFHYGSMEEVIGKNVLAFIAAEDRPRMEKAFQRILETGGIKDAECMALRRDDTTFSAEFSASLVMAVNGRTQAVIAIGKDITIRKQAEQLLQKEKDHLADKVAETTSQLQKTTEWLHELVSHSPTAIFSTSASEDFTAVYVSENISTLLGYEAKQFITDPGFWRGHIHPEDKKRIYAEARLTGERERVSFEYRLLNKKGEYRWIRDERMLARNEKGESSGYVGSLLDITDSKLVEQALRESEERYRTLAKAVPDLIFIIDPEDRIQYVNSFAAAFIGSPPEDLIGQPRERFFPPATRNRQKENILKVLRGGKMFYFEDMTAAPDRSVWLGTWLVPLRDYSGKISAVLGVSRDITRQKQTEAAIVQSRDQLEERVKERTADLLASQSQLRRLTNQVITAQEEERRRISRELHDDAGQALISLKYSLASTLNEIPESHALIKKRLTDSMEIVDRTMGQIRTMAHSLRPPVLDIGGINLSLQDCCQEFMDRTCLRVDYRGRDIPELSDEISISLYRFVQEALTNTLKHARATEAKVRLEYRRKQILLSVSDNGRGIHEPSHSDGIGLLGIRERLDLLGGRLQISSPKGRGMKLVASVPWPRIEEERTIN